MKLYQFQPINFFFIFTQRIPKSFEQKFQKRILVKVSFSVNENTVNKLLLSINKHSVEYFVHIKIKGISTVFILLNKGLTFRPTHLSYHIHQDMKKNVGQNVGLFVQ